MKKILLSAAAIMAAMTMNAQEVCSFNVDNALGLDSENGTALTAGTEIGKTASIIATIGADDTYKPQSVKATAGDQEINGGLQGSNNPKDADSGTPATTLQAPVSGAYLQFEALADGYLYVIHKASSNKAYTVFEEGTAISYTFAAIGDASTDLGAVYQFTLPYEVENEQFVVKNAIEWAEREYLKIAKPDVYESRLTTNEEGQLTWSGDDLKKGGIGVIMFPVYEGCKYIVNANGSKLTAGGFVFSTEDNVTIASGDVTIYSPEGVTPQPTKVYSVIGNFFGDEWTKDYDMVYLPEENCYSVMIENVPAGNYEFKIRQDHDWAINWGSDYKQDGPNFKIEVATDGSMVIVSFNPETGEAAAVVYGNDATQEQELDLTAAAWGWGWGSTTTNEGDMLVSTLTGDWGAVSTGWDPAADWSAYKTLVCVIESCSTTSAEGAFFQILAKGDSDDKKAAYYSWSETFDTPQTIEIPLDPAYSNAVKQFWFQGKAVGDVIKISKVYLTTKETTAIKGVKAIQAEDAIYNLAGQKVDASYKGIVIKGGKKMIQK